MPTHIGVLLMAMEQVQGSIKGRAAGMSFTRGNINSTPVTSLKRARPITIPDQIRVASDYLGVKQTTSKATRMSIRRRSQAFRLPG